MCPQTRTPTSASPTGLSHGDDEGAILPCVLRQHCLRISRGDAAVMVQHGPAGLTLRRGRQPIRLQDLPGFGRREMHVGAVELESLVAYQIGALAAIAAWKGFGSATPPHGALTTWRRATAIRRTRSRTRSTRWIRRSSCSTVRLAADRRRQGRRPAGGVGGVCRSRLSTGWQPGLAGHARRRADGCGCGAARSPMAAAKGVTCVDGPLE